MFHRVLADREGEAATSDAHVHTSLSFATELRAANPAGFMLHVYKLLLNYLLFDFMSCGTRVAFRQPSGPGAARAAGSSRSNTRVLFPHRPAAAQPRAVSRPACIQSRHQGSDDLMAGELRITNALRATYASTGRAGVGAAEVSSLETLAFFASLPCAVSSAARLPSDLDSTAACVRAAPLATGANRTGKARYLSRLHENRGRHRSTLEGPFRGRHKQREATRDEPACDMQSGIPWACAIFFLLITLMVFTDAESGTPAKPSLTNPLLRSAAGAPMRPARVHASLLKHRRKKNRAKATALLMAPDP